MIAIWAISILGVLQVQMPFLIPDVAPGVNTTVALRELKVLAKRDNLNDLILVELYYWLWLGYNQLQGSCSCAGCYGTGNEWKSTGGRGHFRAFYFIGEWHVKAPSNDIGWSPALGSRQRKATGGAILAGQRLQRCCQTWNREFVFSKGDGNHGKALNTAQIAGPATAMMSTHSFSIAG